MSEALKEFETWRSEVDCDHLLDTFDLALGWFSGKGFAHEDALHMAEVLVATEQQLVARC